MAARFGRFDDMISSRRVLTALAIAVVFVAGCSHKTASDSENPYRHVPLPSPTHCQPELRVSSAVMNAYKLSAADQRWIRKMVGYLRPADRPRALWASIDEPSNTKPPHQPYLIVYDDGAVFAMQYQAPPVVDAKYWDPASQHDIFDRCQGIIFAGAPP
jgi:hypothetical protein